MTLLVSVVIYFKPLPANANQNLQYHPACPEPVEGKNRKPKTEN
jgi:hypothetical protein